MDVVVLEGVPHDNDDGHLVPVLAEHQIYLTGQKVELQMEPSGKNRRFDTPSLRAMGNKHTI